MSCNTQIQKPWEVFYRRKQYPIPVAQEQALAYTAADVAQGLGIELATFLFPLLVALDEVQDKRLVRTFLATVQLIITFGDRVHGLLLSEMGGLLLDPEHERAGSKRLANLVHSPRWSAELMEQFLWQRATSWLGQLEQDGQPVYAIWDESVWEKPESLKMEDLGPVRHPDFAVPLSWVVSRQGKGRRPWYILTTQEVRTEEQAWQIVFAYARRWDIEGTWRFDKSELGFECPRLRQWEHCHNLLLLATLAYVFLLTLLRQEKRRVRTWLLYHSCHRTGKKAREARLPLYRLRLAVSRLWKGHPPRFECLAMRRLA